MQIRMDPKQRPAGSHFVAPTTCWARRPAGTVRRMAWSPLNRAEQTRNVARLTGESGGDGKNQAAPDRFRFRMRNVRKWRRCEMPMEIDNFERRDAHRFGPAPIPVSPFASVAFPVRLRHRTWTRPETQRPLDPSVAPAKKEVRRPD